MKKLEALARKFFGKDPRNDYAASSDEEILEHLMMFAKAVRRQTLREERSRFPSGAETTSILSDRRSKGR